MGIKRGEITTKVIRNGLVFNFDAANRASTIPSTSTTKTLNTVDLSQSGSFTADAQFDSSTISPSFALDGTGDYINLGNSSILNFSSQRPPSFSVTSISSLLYLQFESTGTGLTNLILSYP